MKIDLILLFILCLGYNLVSLFYSVDVQATEAVPSETSQSDIIFNAENYVDFQFISNIERKENYRKQFESEIVSPIGTISSRASILRSSGDLIGLSEYFTTQTTYIDVAADYTGTFWPICLSTFYSQSTSKRAMKTENLETLSILERIIGVNLNYIQNDTVSAFVSSNYALTDDALYPSEKTGVLSHEFGASILPLSNSVITPMVSYRKYSYLLDEDRFETSFSISISYEGLCNTIDLYLWSEYYRARGAEGQQEDSGINTVVQISWETKYFHFPQTQFSLGLDYERYKDEMYLDNSYTVYSSFLSLKIPF